MGGIISPPFGGYIGSSNLVLLTLVLLSPPGYARPGERHAYASTNTATYSTRRIMLSGLAFCPFLKCYITICPLADLWRVATQHNRTVKA